MDFRLNEEQELFRASARKFFETECRFENRAKAVAMRGGDRGIWKKFADMGWLALGLPESCGGLGGMIETAILMEEIGRSLCVEPFWAVNCLAGQTIAACPDRIKAEPLLSALIAGELRLVLAHGEQEAGAEIGHVATRAQPAAGGWTLSGTKPLVVGGDEAEFFLVSARTSGDMEDERGITLFLVRRDVPGLRLVPVRLLDNHWGVHLELDRVAVGRADVLGEVDGAFPALREGHDKALLALGAEAVGLMERAIWTTRDYLQIRKQFGAVLASFQSLQHRMSEMLIELELSRSMVYRALAHLDAPGNIRSQAISAMKYHIGMSGKFVCGQAIQLHGGIGVTEEHVIGHYFKRMTLIDCTLGNSHQHLEHLAAIERGLAAEDMRADPIFS